MTHKSLLALVFVSLSSSTCPPLRLDLFPAGQRMGQTPADGGVEGKRKTYSTITAQKFHCIS